MIGDIKSTVSGCYRFIACVVLRLRATVMDEFAFLARRSIPARIAWMHSCKNAHIVAVSPIIARLSKYNRQAINHAAQVKEKAVSTAGDAP